jgi:ribonuclease P protein component
MVNTIRFKGSPVRIKPLKSRKSDFFRINPRSIVKIGKKRLVKRGLVAKDASPPEDNPNHFIAKNVIAHWAKTRFADGDMHVGFTITIKTISKRANERNLVRRRLRAAVNENIRAFKVAGHDFVFTAREAIKEAAYTDIVSDLRRILKFAEHRIAEEK